MSEVVYQKMAKNGFGLIYQTILYSSDDHLLLRKASTFTNGYSRFFFHDIQAIYMRKKMGFGWMLFLWGLLLSGSIVLSLWAPTTVAAVFPVMLAILFGFLFFRTLVGGPLCEVTLETAAQSVHLSALGTERKALEVMDEIKQKIESIQGVVIDADLMAEAAPAPRRQLEPSSHLSVVTPYHWGTYLCWLASAGLLGLVFFQNVSQATGGIIFLLLLTAFVTGTIGASLNLRRRRQRTPLEWLTYLSLGFLLLRATIYYFFIVLVGLDNGAITTQALMDEFIHGNIFNKPEFNTWYSIEAIFAALFGILGLLLCVFAPKSRGGS